MRKINGVLALAMACLLYASSAVAQAPARLPCPECRAIAHFRGCKAPREGAIAFIAKVMSVKRVRCSQVLTLDVMRASAVGLPSAIQVDLGFCATWAGKSGDMIDMAVTAQATDGKVYALACNLW